MLVSSASLCAFRALFGVLMVVSVMRFAGHGWIAEYYLEPQYFFPYPGLEWIQPWPGIGMYLHYAVMGLAALGIALGYRTWLSAAVFFTTFTWAHLIDRTNYLNHYHLVSVLALLLVVLPLHRERVPAWMLWVVRAQVGLVYVFGGVAKLQSDWLLRAEPLSTWLLRNQDFPVIGAYFSERWVGFAMSWAGAAFDLSVVPFLLYRRTRPFAYATLVVFHLVTARLFHIGMFPWIMIAASLVFFSPEWPKNARAWLFGGEKVAPLPAPFALRAPAATWIALQCALALRGLFYSGDTLWTEEGFRFAWRVMVMEKNGAAELVVRDPDDGREWHVLPSQYLTPMQARMVSTQPDMIVSFAHIVDESMRARGVRDPEVRADVMVSLNGRPAQRLIDPTVDLSRDPPRILELLR